jgi:hypothetical protein
MKKDPKLTTKLHLSRETLLALEQSDLVVVNGGVSELTSCNGCNTRNTCTSRYC